MVSKTYTISCPFVFMKVILVIVVFVVIAGSIFADWKWRQWVKARRRERDSADGNSPR